MELRTPKNNQQIMIRFPDHEITRQIVQSFHADIKSVHFHTPCNPRYELYYNILFYSINIFLFVLLIFNMIGIVMSKYNLMQI